MEDSFRLQFELAVKKCGPWARAEQSGVEHRAHGPSRAGVARAAGCAVRDAGRGAPASEAEQSESLAGARGPVRRAMCK